MDPRSRIAFAAALFLALTSSALAEIDKYHITPVEKAACMGDATALCSDAYPDEDRLVSCMKTNESRLSMSCLVVFKAGLKRRHL